MNEMTLSTSGPSNTGIGMNLTLDAAAMNSMVALAEIMSTGKATIPKEYQGSKGDCLAVVMQAVQWGMNPFTVAQKTHFVSGKIGYEAQLVNAVVQSSRSISGRFHYEYRGTGEQLECRVGAVIAGETDVTWGEWLMLSDITVRNSPLWKTNQKQQISYLQVKNWARLYCPGAIMGVYTPDELEEVKPERDITPQPQGSGLDRLLGAGKKNQPAADESVELEGFLSVIPSINGMPDWQQKYAAAWTWAEKQSVEIQKEIKKAYLGHRVKLMKEDVDSAINAGDFGLAIDLIGSLPEKCQQEMRDKVEAAKQENIPV